MTARETAGPDRAGESQVEVIGSTQRWFINRPTVKVYWNGVEVGAVQHGGRLAFGISADGDVRFTCSVRSAEVSVTCGDDTTIQLSWDRVWGRLLARAV